MGCSASEPCVPSLTGWIDDGIEPFGHLDRSDAVWTTSNAFVDGWTPDECALPILHVTRMA